LYNNLINKYLKTKKFSFNYEKDIGLVLSSGGARGATQIGVIKTLEKQGYNIKSVSGASIGSMIAGMYARGDLYEFEQWITSLSEEEILNLLGFTLKKMAY